MKLVLLILFILISSGNALAQTNPTASVRGIIRDQNDALVPRARVTLRKADTIAERTAVTGPDGIFMFGGLSAGEYRIEVQADGFGMQNRTINIAGNTTEDIQFVLSVGETQFTVTAETGRSEDKRNVPQSVNVISESAISERATSLAQAGREEAGLNVQKTSPTIGAIVVRGLTGKNVVNFVDGVRYTTGAQRGGINTFFNLNDSSNLQAIEVLRGPNSAQYGSDSLGGTVNLLTKSPNFSSDLPEFHGEFNPSFTSADRSYGSSAAIGYGTRRFNIFSVAAARRINTMRTANGLDSHSAITRFLGLPSSVLYDRNPDTEFSQYGGSFRLNYLPGDDQQVVFFYQRGQQDDAKRFDQLLGGDGNLIADLKNLMLDFGYLRYVKQGFLGFGSASFTASYNTQREERVNQGGQGNPAGDIIHQYERTSVAGFSFFLDKQFPGNNAFLFGGDFYHEKINAPAFTVNLITNVTRVSRPRIPDQARFNSAGLFIQSAWQAIPDRLRVTGALRYGAAVYKVRAADAPVVGGRRLWNDDSLRDAAFSGRIGAVIRVADNFRVAVNYSRGFRYPSMTDLGTLGLTGDGFEVDYLASSSLGGTIGTTAGPDAVTTGIPVAKQSSEVSHNLDFGLRYQNKRFDTEFTVFRLDLGNAITKQALILPPGAVGQFLGDQPITSQLPNGVVFVPISTTPVIVRANFSDARLYGFEFEAEGKITGEFSARANFTYIHAADKKTGLPPNIEGGTPPPTAFVSLRYTKPRFWLEIYSTLAGEQRRLSSGDLNDRRTGGARTRIQIQNFFRRGACVRGLTTPGTTGQCGSPGGILIATGETLEQVQNRVLPGVDNNTAVPFFTYLPSYATANLRGGFRINEKAGVFVAFENILDSFYRNPSWGIDGAGRSINVQLRYKF